MVSTYLISIAIATLFGWASFAVVLFKLSPFTSTTLALSLFYASLFIALSGTFSLLIHLLRAGLSRGQAGPVQINTAVRQGTLLSLMVCVATAFQRLRVLTWWDGILLLAIVLLIEFYFSSRE